MKTKLKILSIICLLLTMPTFAHAEWYWLTIPDNPVIGDFTDLSAIEYAITSIPKDQLTLLPEGFMDALSSSTKSVQCYDEYNIAQQRLRDFDAHNDFYTKIYYKGTTGQYDIADNAETVSARNDLLKSIEQDVQYCLKQEQAELQEKADKDAKEKRQLVIQTALKECDFNFFENEMTDEERMNTWNERTACETTPSNLPVVATTTVKLPDILVPKQATPPGTLATPKPQLVAKNTPITEENATHTDENTIATTSTIQTITETETQPIDKIEPIPMEHDSFFQRIINFVSRLFNFF